jgi:hypothetical protein
MVNDEHKCGNGLSIFCNTWESPNVRNNHLLLVGPPAREPLWASVSTLAKGDLQWTLVLVLKIETNNSGGSTHVLSHYPLCSSSDHSRDFNSFCPIHVSKTQHPALFLCACPLAVAPLPWTHRDHLVNKRDLVHGRQSRNMVSIQSCCC